MTAVESKDSTPLTLSKTIENLLRNEYGRYVVLLNDQMGDIREPNMDYAHLCVDFQPLVFGKEDARNREVEKLATLSRYIDNPGLLRVARRMQGLIALHDTIDRAFELSVMNGFSEDVNLDRLQEFRAAATAALQPRLREMLMPDTVHSTDSSAMLAQMNLDRAAVDALSKLTTHGESPKPRMAVQEWRDLQSAFAARIQNISGLNIGQRK